MPLVVDASVALAWALPDESSAYADAVLIAVEREGLRVPELWTSEIANGLAVAFLRKRITSADEAVFLSALSNLRIEVEKASAAVTAIRDATAAAMRYGLTAYDAAYVDLALREGLTLATLDAAMRKAAEKADHDFPGRVASGDRQWNPDSNGGDHPITPHHPPPTPAISPTSPPHPQIPFPLHAIS
jgi:predicted nucleic acid-binding protein